LASSAGLISAGFIAAGMSFQQVLKALGPAPDKVEYEASRRNIWHYNDGQVVFKEGQVVKLNTGTQSGVEIPVPAQRPMSPAVVKDPKVSKEAERVLLDILKEIPSGSESPFDPNSGVPAPGTPLTPQPLHMNHGAMPFGGISGGGYDDMAE